MARVTITREEAEEGLLPEVCALTGRRTADIKRKVFYWQPAWTGVLFLAGVLPYVIASMVLRRRMVVELPLMRGKRGHWEWRSAVTLVAVLVAVVGGLISGSEARHLGGRGQNFSAGLLYAVGPVALIAAIALGIVLHSSAIRPTEVTDDAVTLVNVHTDFAVALEEERRRQEVGYEHDSGRRFDEDYRPRQVRTDDDEDDRD